MFTQCVLNIMLPENDLINIKFADIFYKALCRYKPIYKVAINTLNLFKFLFNAR